MACGDGFGHPGREVPDRGEDHAVGRVRAGEERADRVAVVASQRSLAPEDVVPELRAFEQQVFEGVVDQVGRRVLVGVDLVDDHLLLAFELPLGECRAEGDVGDQLRGLRKVAAQGRGVYRRVLLGGECVELSAELVEIAAYHRRTLAGCPLEHRVLREVGDSRTVAGLVPRAALYAEGTIGHCRPGPPHGILQSAICTSVYHPYLVAIL